MSDEPRSLDLSTLSRKNRVAAAAEKPTVDPPVERSLTLAPRPQAAPQIIAEAGDTIETPGERQVPSFQPDEETRTPPSTPPTPPASSEVQRQAPASQADADGLTAITMSVRVTAGVRNRAREAYRLTGYSEGDTSFGAFVELALEREIQRRQDLYNHGQPFQSNPRRLTSGPAPS